MNTCDSYTQVMLRKNKRILLLMTVDANDMVGPLAVGLTPEFLGTGFSHLHHLFSSLSFSVFSQVLKLFTPTSSSPSRLSLWKESFHHGVKVGRRRQRLDQIAVPSAQREMLCAAGGQ